MSTQEIGLFKAIAAKMDYLSQRHKVIAENIANSDTPGYKPKDLTPVDFSSVLKGVTSNRSVQPSRTDPKHISAAGAVGQAQDRTQKSFYEVSPTGNAVVMEEQLLNAGRNVMDYNLMLNLYQKQIGMMKIALGVR
ncbi:MAG: flagellar basal body rod protein FlgB [Rhodospirillales bacterium]|nr:flagellar basal body rod protein FlgB [Alphaproteobacteria bacterium]MCB9976186.1 flagellar basal body rod protein FlgB [Rhodospirillales bacterium]